MYDVYTLPVLRSGEGINNQKPAYSTVRPLTVTALPPPLLPLPPPSERKERCLR